MSANKFGNPVTNVRSSLAARANGKKRVDKKPPAKAAKKRKRKQPAAVRGATGVKPPPKKAQDGEPIEDSRGILVPRIRRRPGADLIDPRLPAWEAEIAAARLALMERDQREQQKERAAGGKSDNESTPLEIHSGIPEAIYRYSKGPDFVNDEVGYGEVITELMWHVDEANTEVKKANDAARAEGRTPNCAVMSLRVSQRTKTGRQVLKKLVVEKTPE